MLMLKIALGKNVNQKGCVVAKTVDELTRKGQKKLSLGPIYTN